jgi:Immunoglobulin-like domain of bacterial spore germination
MRPAHIRLVAVAGVLAVVVGVAAAFVVSRDNAAPSQPVAAATPTTSAAGQDAAANDGTDAPRDTAPKAPKDDPDPGEQAAKAAAVGFLRELGMRDPVAASYRATGDATAEVGIHPRTGEGGRLLDRVTTLVQLHRYVNGWVPTGAKAVNAIEVDQPLPFARILSPLTVSGLSSAYEGTVHVRVTEDRRGPDRELGKGFVNGGATELGPFSGPIGFAHPSGDAGWVVFSGDTGIDAGIMSATAVRVRFVNSDHEPQILDVTTSPAPTGSSRLVNLTGSGTFTVRVKAFAADEVRVLLVPSGTGGRPHAKLIGVDNSSEDGERWSVSWRYPDESFHGHLLIQVNGRGGSAEHDGIAVMHA